MNRVAFRVDASLLIGAGHVMRCLTLANALQKIDVDCFFICRDLEGNLIDLIRRQGFLVRQLNKPTGAAGCHESLDSKVPYAKWLGVHWWDDANETRSFLSRNVDWLIVDHYALDQDWEDALRPFCMNIMVIDDLADRLHDCDLLLDQTLSRTESTYRPLVPASCKIACGSNFALLRPEFSLLRGESLQRRADPGMNCLLINMGGIDKDNVTRRVLEALQFSCLPEECTINVVLGEASPWVVSVREVAATMRWTTEVMVGVQNMAELMTGCDLAIGAAGATSWERCCLGLPCITFILADNQVNAAKQLEGVRAVVLLEQDEDLATSLNKFIRRFIDVPEELSEMSTRAQKIVDGYGSIRLIDEMRKIVG